ncbi:unnamed protein product [Caenorhabditis auriculariae]|uniref:Uncharacterized protein n=1 Tax=Caenorhabditis auriculariae TaxID=2777116 RepID=A0A8S1HJT1_9PELO|nr:unnamed protein product [Caenorhabditis auriculariae]
METELGSVAVGLHCLQPFVPENGHVIFNELGPYAPSTIAKYSCALGFERVGREERTCRSDGSWSGSAPFCAIDVAANKPMHQSSGNVATSLSRSLCTMTENEPKSFWEVDLLDQYSVRSISLRLGAQSSPVTAVDLILSSGQVKHCSLNSTSFTPNATTTVSCTSNKVSRVRVSATHRLHLCEANVFATDAVSPWQCAQSSMDVVGVFGGMCYAASRDEQTDWLGAQRKCLDRGATLPLRIDDQTRRGLRSALSAALSPQPFYWIGASSSLTEWRWVDGDAVGKQSDWPSANAPEPAMAEAVLLARPLDWRWVPASQTAWNSFLCQSKPKFCTSPGVGEATRVVFSSHSYAIGTACYYSCEDGYELEGAKQRECGENGRWSGSIPNCYRKSCGDLPQWKYGKVRLLNKTTLYQSEVEYECLSGWKLVGEQRRSCQSDGKWSGEEPVCQQVDCGRPSQIANGRVDFTSTTFESQANYTCQPGFRVIGPETVLCSERAHWEPSTPFCYDLATLQELKGTPASSGEPSDASNGNLALAILSVALVSCIVVAVLKMARTSEKMSASQDKLNSSSAIYATPNINAPRSGDSVVYYASCAPLAQMEVPPHMLQLQQLPNGNIHVTLPLGRPLVRPALPVFSASPTPSQILYSFDDEPIYDTPPDVGSAAEDIYERLPRHQPLPPAPPVRRASEMPRPFLDR